MSRLRPNAPRYQRRIFTVGMLAALVLFCIGFPIFNNRIEADLEQRVPDELADAGFAGVTASFSGQDGTLRCTAPLADPEAATQVAYDVWGVRTITLDRRCRVNRAPTVGPEASDTSGSDSSSGSGTSGSATATADPAAFATIAGAVAGDPQLSFLRMLLDESGLGASLADPVADPVTLFAPTDDAFDRLPADVTAQLRANSDLLRTVLGHHVATGIVRSADLKPGALAMMDGTPALVAVDGGDVTVGGSAIVQADVVAGNGIVHVVDEVLLPPGFEVEADQAASVAASFDGGRFTLTGTVASEVERVTLVDTATAATAVDTVTDELTVDADTGLDAATVGQLANLLAAMPQTLVSGSAGFDGSALYLEGVAINSATADDMGAIATAVGVTAAIEVQAGATDTEAADLEGELNATVAADPIRFESGSAVLTAGAATVLDRLAEEVLALGGVTITVEGHTDSVGDATANQTLSQLRAEAVREALIERGVDAGVISAAGFGAQRPVLVNGVEDQAASRRVEFRVEPIA